MPKKPKPEDKGPGMGWIVTFSDCMTLLLCFFVLLLTFSTFEEKERLKIVGLFEQIRMESIFRNKFSDTGAIPPPETDQVTPKGSDKKSADDHRLVRFPKVIDPRDEQDHLKDSRTLYLPSKVLFADGSAELTEKATREFLPLLAEFLRMNEASVVFFRECRSGLVQRSEQLALERAAALVRHCAGPGEISRDRLGTGATDLGDRMRLGSDEPLIAITILNRSTYTR